MPRLVEIVEPAVMERNASFLAYSGMRFLDHIGAEIKFSPNIEQKEGWSRLLLRAEKCATAPHFPAGYVS
jgi:hypothetical protein